jgi:hypothetical protein
MDENKLFELYCKGVITEDKLTEKLKLAKRKAIERYLDLYLEGCITKDDLIDVLSE